MSGIPPWLQNKIQSQNKTNRLGEMVQRASELTVVLAWLCVPVIPVLPAEDRKSPGGC